MTVIQFIDQFKPDDTGQFRHEELIQSQSRHQELIYVRSRRLAARLK